MCRNLRAPTTTVYVILNHVKPLGSRARVDRVTEFITSFVQRVLECICIFGAYSDVDYVVMSVALILLVLVAIRTLHVLMTLSSCTTPHARFVSLK